MCTSHLAGQGQLLDQTDVETGRIESAARDRHQVSHAPWRDCRVLQGGLTRGNSQCTGLLLVLPHPIQGRRVCGRVERLPAVQGAIRLVEDHAVSALDAGPPIQRQKQPFLSRCLAGILLGDLGRIDLRDSMRWDGRADTGDKHAHSSARLRKGGRGIHSLDHEPGNSGNSGNQFKRGVGKPRVVKQDR